MREKLNSNPLAQVAIIGFLLVATGFFVLSSMGGGEDETEGGATEATVSVAETGASGTATGATPEEAVEGAIEAAGEAAVPAAPTSVPPLPPSAAASAPPLPRAVTSAFEADRTVVLLFVRRGGIDDRMVASAVEGLESVPDVASFVVPAERIARYAAIAQGVAVDRVPALVVVSPKRLDKDIPTASVHYGFQSPQSVRQAVIDAGYKGRTLAYHP
jgi:hypothetical protein